MNFKDPWITNVNFRDDMFYSDIEDRNSDQYELIMKFMFHLAVCHTVIIQNENDETGKRQITYSASSPDELALVNAARYFGFCFKDWDADNNISIEFRNVLNWESMPVVFKFQLLNVIEFSSARKWMTVIVKTPDGNIKALVKGADSIIQARLSDSNSPVFN